MAQIMESYEKKYNRKKYKKSSIEIINRKETKSIVSNIMASIDFLDPLWPFWGAEIKKRQTGFDSTPHHSTPYRATPLLTSPSDNDEIKSNYRIHISFAKKPISAKKKNHIGLKIFHKMQTGWTRFWRYIFFLGSHSVQFQLSF